MTPKFWAASVRSKNPEMFPSFKCASYEDYKSNKCGDVSTALMGLYVDKNSSGRFYLDAKLSNLRRK